MGTFVDYLASFSGSFKAALALWPLLSFMLTLPMLAFIYHRDGRLTGTTIVASYISMLYIAGLACFTLYPLPSGDSGPGITYGIPPILDPLNFISDIQKDGWRAVLQLLFNVALFVPLGFIARVLLRMRALPTFALSLFITCLIETAQLTGLFGIYPFAYRTFEVDDIICNTLGGMMGWLLGARLMKVLPHRTEEKPPITHEPGFVRRAIALWLDSMIIAFCTAMPWLIVAALSERFLGVAFCLPGLDAAQTAFAFFTIYFALGFIIDEVVIPWTHDGSTPGGMFVRMSFETRSRRGWRRIVFYGARAATLLLVFAFPVPLSIVLVLFYAISGRMPYDFIPG